MYQENELEQIRLRKIQAMLDAAKKGQTPVSTQPIILTAMSITWKRLS
jgi:hypothetical protein